ncbi:MAG: N-6 DNA methylase [Nitrospirae bacterium]|nr:N-6 DNA methylase [Nitrospirota bacterium]
MPTVKKTLSVERKNGEVFSHIRKKWLIETPEERVRQEYLCVLVNEYGFSLEHIDEELSVTGRGSGDARADFLIWRTQQEKADKKTALIVVECKADNVTIDNKAYLQGANYAQYERAKFFVTHNNRETKFWKVDLERRMPNYDEIEDIPHAEATDKEIEEIISRLKVFREDEFADLLHQCHNIIRNREKLDPAAAFDEIAKILFVKVCFERRLKGGKQRKNLFSKDFLIQQKDLYEDPIDTLFAETKKEYRADKIFEQNEKINLKFNTVKDIVEKLERYNLSDTSEDVKGIAFEKFLGRTFRGEIGQFFTPRTIVEFMIRMVDPKEEDIICDPASGSGGFLIRFFEIVREQILRDVDRQYQTYKEEIEAGKYSRRKKAELLRQKYEQLQRQINPYASREKATRDDAQTSRIWKLANTCIYGCDANDRMARTSKMNMIMHGDGHGGVHHHDGFINVNGIFEERFDIVLTNPPFGANVEDSDIIEESHVTVHEDVEKRYRSEYGSLYKEAIEKVRAAIGKPILDLFDLPKTSRIKTEILFIERCLALLKPGGRLGIVLPEGIFNNPSLAYVREYCEDRAFIRAVVSLPQETFFSSGASVKASLLFVQKFTEKEKADFDALKAATLAEIEMKYREQKTQLQEVIAKTNYNQSDFLPTGIKTPSKEQKAQASDKAKEANVKLKEEKEKAKKALKELEAIITKESRALLKERFSYPIFMYEVEKVGIAATGEADYNELYPNDNMPSGTEKSCLEWYREFRKNPGKLLVSESSE